MAERVASKVDLDMKSNGEYGQGESERMSQKKQKEREKERHKGLQ